MLGVIPKRISGGFVQFGCSVSRRCAAQGTPGRCFSATFSGRVAFPRAHEVWYAQRSEPATTQAEAGRRRQVPGPTRDRGTILEALLTAENAIALATLASLEIVLGIDNIVFIAILTQKLPVERQAAARRIGLIAAMLMRIGLLLVIGWVMGLTAVLFSVFDQPFSGRDLILLGGGLFLVGKATWEIHDKLEGEIQSDGSIAGASMSSVILQIMVLDMVFSLDSVITAVGMANEIAVMITAVVLSVAVMLVFAERISRFIEAHPTMKMLALSFLILIGVVLMLEGLGKHVEKGYIYFAMAFALSVEMVNLAVRNRNPVQLHRRYRGPGDYLEFAARASEAAAQAIDRDWEGAGAQRERRAQQASSARAESGGTETDREPS